MLRCVYAKHSSLFPFYGYRPRTDSAEYYLALKKYARYLCEALSLVFCRFYYQFANPSLCLSSSKVKKSPFALLSRAFLKTSFCVLVGANSFAIFFFLGPSGILRFSYSLRVIITSSSPFVMVLGIIIFAFCIFLFYAPPFKKSTLYVKVLHGFSMGLNKAFARRDFGAHQDVKDFIGFFGVLNVYLL